MKWPNKLEREQFEINGFIEAYARLPESRQFEVVSKGETPDYVVRDTRTGEEYGVELTSVYLNDRSVPDVHMQWRDEAGMIEIPYDKEELEKYTKRLIDAIVDKVCKARKGYDSARPLILSIYVNEYIATYLRRPKLEEFVRRYEGLFDAMAPFTEIVFWGIDDNEVFSVRPS